MVTGTARCLYWSFRFHSDVALPSPCSSEAKASLHCAASGSCGNRESQTADVKPCAVVETGHCFRGQAVGQGREERRGRRSCRVREGDFLEPSRTNMLCSCLNVFTP